MDVAGVPVGVAVGVFVGVDVDVGVADGVPQVDGTYDIPKPGDNPPVLHSNCVNIAPVPCCRPTVAELLTGLPSRR